jgi:8-oxo-dGTP pyrophosphatase MutT (NUDIX family)
VQPPAVEPGLVRGLPVPLRRLIYRFAYQGLRAWWFVWRPEVSGVKCVLTDRDHVLLVRHTYGPRGWDLPGGTVEPGEDPAQTARREIEEELGVLIDDWQGLGEIDNTLEHRRDHLHCFAAELPAPELRLDPGEIQTARWFPIGELPSPLNYYVEPILVHAGLARPRPSA